MKNKAFNIQFDPKKVFIALFLLLLAAPLILFLLFIFVGIVMALAPVFLIFIPFLVVLPFKFSFSTTINKIRSMAKSILDRIKAFLQKEIQPMTPQTT